MSDNLFIFGVVDGRLRWGSYDVSKMESSHTPADIWQIVDTVVNSFHWDAGEEGYKDAIRLATYYTSIDAQVLLGKEKMRLPYLASGCAGTADYNCWKMSKVVRLMYYMMSDETWPEAE